MVQERFFRRKNRVQEARHVRVAAVLSGFWHTHTGVTWQDAAATCIFMLAAAGLAYTWRPYVDRVSDTRADEE